MKLIEGLEYLFYTAVIALLIYGPPPAQDEDETNATDSTVAVAHTTTDAPHSR